jgi:hypothetical protein
LENEEGERKHICCVPDVDNPSLRLDQPTTLHIPLPFQLFHDNFQTKNVRDFCHAIPVTAFVINTAITKIH